MHAAQRLPVRLVEAVRRRVTGILGQLHEQPGSGGDEPRRHRQLLGEPPQLSKVVPEGKRGLLLERVGKHVGGDEGVAVAVAADPRTDPQ